MMKLNGRYVGIGRRFYQGVAVAIALEVALLALVKLAFLIFQTLRVGL